MAKKKAPKELTPKEKVLEHANNLDRVVVLGHRPDGGFEITSTETSYADIIYLLNKGIFEMLLHQKSTELNKKENA